MKPPITTQDGKQPPYHPILRGQEYDPTGRLAWDQNGLMWVWTRIRRRAYVCSRDERHVTYWRTHWDQGTNDYVACEHEVTIVHEGDA